MVKAAALVLAVGLSLVGCGADEGSGAGDRVDVVAGFYPLAYVAERVGGDRVDVTSLASGGAEPHDLELSPRQAASLEDADLVLHLRGLQPALDDAAPSGRSLDAARVSSLVDDDPHLWLDPTRLAGLATATAQRLADVDPAGTADYAVRGDELAAELLALDAEFQAGLRTCARRVFVTAHAAFGYLAARYDLEQVSISGVDPDSDPAPARLREVAAVMRRRGVTTVFVEPLLPDAIGRTVAAETGATLAVLDPIESVAAGSGDDYAVVMRRNLEALRAALGCT